MEPLFCRIRIRNVLIHLPSSLLGSFTIVKDKRSLVHPFRSIPPPLVISGTAFSIHSAQFHLTRSKFHDSKISNSYTQAVALIDRLVAPFPPIPFIRNASLKASGYSLPCLYAIAIGFSSSKGFLPDINSYRMQPNE